MASGRPGASVGTEPDVQIADEAVLTALVADLGVDNVARVSAMFVRESVERVGAIRAAIEAGDLETAAVAAHRLKSAAGFLGAVELARLCGDVERLSRAGWRASARSFAGDLPAQVEQASTEIERIVGHTAANGPGSG